MEKDLCRACGGSGDGMVLSSPDDINSAAFETVPCAFCFGTGFRHSSPIIQSRAVLYQENRKAMNAAVLAIQEAFAREGK